MFTSTKLIILDRDGVINHELGTYVTTVDDFRLIEGSAQAIAAFNKRGIKVAVATNQGGIGRGLYTEDDLHMIHQKMHTNLAEHGAHVDKVFFAPDHPDSPTHRRKPNAGMLEEALACFSASPEEALMVGDNVSDLYAARAAKCQPVWLQSGKPMPAEKPADLENVPVFLNLEAFAEVFCKEVSCAML